MLKGLSCAIIAFSIVFIVRKIADLWSISGSSSFQETTKLNWRKLKDFYWINPDRWTFDTVLKRGSTIFPTNSKVLIYRAADGKKIRIKLTLGAWIKFTIKRLTNTRKSDRGMESLLTSVQSDINKAREENERQMEEAARQAKIALERMNKEKERR